MKKELSTLEQNARNFFVKHKTVKCPAFPRENIVFNSKGFNHLFYKGSMEGRPMKEVETRITLLPQALKVLKKMPLWQEEREINHKGKNYHFWALEAVIDQKRIKVIIRQKGTGKKCFWSVIPSWRRIDGKIINARSEFESQ